MEATIEEENFKAQMLSGLLPMVAGFKVIYD